jgi:SAM-dependent methyltransferase
MDCEVERRGNTFAEGRQARPPRLRPWINVDVTPAPDVTYCDLDPAQGSPRLLKAVGDGVVMWEANHLIEHIRRPLALLEAMWRSSAPGAQAIFRCPYGGSDDAWEDPTHVRPMYPNSFGYYGQPFHWRGDYGYRGDWRIVRCQLSVPRGFVEPPRTRDIMRIATPEQGYERIRKERNIVVEMAVLLEVVKPIREPRRELQEPITIELVEVDVT